MNKIGFLKGKCLYQAYSKLVHPLQLCMLQSIFENYLDNWSWIPSKQSLWGEGATVTSQGHVSGLPGWRKLWCLEAIPWHAPWFLVTCFRDWVNFCLSGSYLSLYKEIRCFHSPKKQCWYIFLSKLLGKERAMLCLVAQLCPTLCNPMDNGARGLQSMGLLQARILEQVAMPSSRASSQSRDWIRISHIAADSLPSEPPGKP